MRSVISARDFFDHSQTRKVFSNFLPKSKELVIMDVEDVERPYVIDVKKLSSKQLKICSRTASIQRPDGSVFFTGGIDESRNKPHNSVGDWVTQLYHYDIFEGTMNQLADMHFVRASHGICLNNRFVYVCGGKNEADLPQKTFERYDSSINSWERLPDCIIPAIRPLLVMLNDRFIFKIGGITSDERACNTIERFDLSKNEWTMCNYIVKEEGKNLRAAGFGFHTMMTGVQVNYNSILV